jgi:hypothetical protein
VIVYVHRLCRPWTETTATMDRPQKRIARVCRAAGSGLNMVDGETALERAKAFARARREK